MGFFDLFKPKRDPPRRKPPSTSTSSSKSTTSKVPAKWKNRQTTSFADCIELFDDIVKSVSKGSNDDID
jgi:hypothetical protein